MSSLFDMISSFIALLMSAAFLHFGAGGGEETVKVDPPAATAPKAAAPGSSTFSSSASVTGAAGNWQSEPANQPETDTARPPEAIRPAPVSRP